MSELISVQIGASDDIKQIVNKLKQQRMVALNKVGQEEVRRAQERIRSSKTDPEGKPWSPWSMATLRQRQRDRNYSGGLLYKTGALYNSLEYTVNQDNTLNIRSSVDYAGFLQFGTPKMPARPFLGWSEKTIQTFSSIYFEGLL